MLFTRINENIVRCAIQEDEISQMGYDLEELFKNQQMATDFMKEIITRAKDFGFSMNENFEAVQSAFFTNHQLVLNIIHINPEDRINSVIQNLLNAFETVEIIGKERLTEILQMAGDEKTQAFNECIAELEKVNQEIEENASAQPENAEEKVCIQGKYLLSFLNLSQAERFCKEAAFAVPGTLYKDKNNYFMIVDLSGIEQDKADGFILQAREYSSNVTQDRNYSAYLEEHAEKLIKENPIEVLKNL